GRKTPSKAYIDPPKEKKEKDNELVPSELDKRLGSLQKAVDNRPLAEIRLERAQRNRDSLRLIFADHHVKYEQLVKELEDSPNPVAVRPLKIDDATGTPVLSPAGMTQL